MNANGILKQHWLHVALHFVVDAVIFALAFIIGTDFVISDDDLHMRLESYLPGILLGAGAFPCLVYIFGLYSPQSYKQRVSKRAIVLATCLIGTVLLMIPLFYLKKSMRIDAEKHGAIWPTAGKDPRSTSVGHFLRQYRIDELPQLLNMLKGDMSFVGPRAERPVFIEELAQQIQYFQERLMVQPGVTGWAQVNYPYGSSVEDAKWKLEYDFYHMKRMSLFLDLLILLDTVRIVLRGGMKGDPRTGSRATRPSGSSVCSAAKSRTPARSPREPRPRRVDAPPVPQ